MDSEISGLLEFTVATLMTSPFLFADEPLVTFVMTALDVVLLQMPLDVHNEGGFVFSWEGFVTICGLRNELFHVKTAKPWCFRSL